MSLSSYIFGTEERKKMPSLSSNNIQQSEPLIRVVKTEPVIEKKKELSLIDLVRSPENEELCLCFGDSCGEWIISNNGNKLSRVSKDVTLPRMDLYFCSHKIKTDEIGYFMTNGHTFLVGYCEEGIKFGYSFPGFLHNYMVYNKYEWKKI
jgi:hypothetical protein